MKKVILILCLFMLASCSVKDSKEIVDYGNLAKELVSYGDKKVKVYVFSKEDCSLCKAANEFFITLAEDDDYKDMFDYIYIPLYDSNWNPTDLGLEKLMLDIMKYFQDEFDGTPYIIVGERGFNGYISSWQMLFKKEIKRCYEADTCNDPIKDLLDNGPKN